MGKKTTSDLEKFLQPFPESVKETTLKLRTFIWDLYPESNELIYDNYNALAVGFSTSEKAGDTFVSIAVYSNYVNLGFNRGSGIADPDKVLEGSGNLYRRLKLNSFEELPESQIKRLMQDAFLNSLSKLKEGQQTSKGKTITKSISPTKRRPG